MGSLKNPVGVDYSKYKCPYDYLEKECGHELKGPEGYEDSFSVWCACGYRGPVFYLNPEDLKLELKEPESGKTYVPGGKVPCCNCQQSSELCLGCCFNYESRLLTK